jgi:Tfp pilus assembly protein PilF
MTTERDMTGAELAARKREAEELFHRAYELQMKGELEQAETHYKRSLELNPTAEAHTFLGWTYSFMGRYDDAIEECKKAIALDPSFGNPYNDIGAYLIETGRLDDAIPWLEKAITSPRYDNYCFPHLNLGRIWERKGLWYKAMEAYQKALEANPKYTLAMKALGRIRGMLN